MSDISQTSIPQTTAHLANEGGSRLSWYPGLDGVRGIAVTLVFTAHYAARQTRSVGWMGVIIFFVLSGFLITGVLWDNRNEPFRFRNFYIRRTLRIFPLFYFVWLCVCIAALFIYEYWRPILTLWPLYLGNYARFIAGTTDVDRVYTANPQLPIQIGHFWSLAVEEQFYLLWPLVVFRVRDCKLLMRICISAMALVLLLRIVLTLTLPSRILGMEFLYRMTFSQADAFLFGGLLALLMRGSEERTLLRSASTLLWSGFIALASSCLLNEGWHLTPISPTAPWMESYGFTMVYLTAGGLILCALRPATIVFHLVTWPPLRLVGRYSYGFYVYHVLLAPVLALLLPPVTYHLSKPLFHATLVLYWMVDFLVILGVSALSFHALEMPLLRLKDRFTVRHRNSDAQEPFKVL